MSGSYETKIRDASGDFDYSTPEGQAALQAVADIVLEIRDEYMGPTARKIALYERTLGLAVVPVLIRRALIVLRRKAGRGARGAR